MVLDGEHLNVIKKRTWKEASDLCRKIIGGHLPWFESKDNLHELLALFKLFKDMALVKAIYIGLRFNTSGVCFYFSSVKYQCQPICCLSTILKCKILGSGKFLLPIAVNL